MIHPFIHIAQYNIRAGAFSCIQHFHAQIRTADPAADQRGVEDHRLHKTILGTS